MGTGILRVARRRPVALLALFVSLGGTSYAAGTALLPGNSVGSAQVIDHSLLSKDFRRGQLPKGTKGAKGVRGPIGARGSIGAAGPAGSTPAAAGGDAPTPPSSPTTNVATVSVSTAAGRTLFVQGRFDSFSYTCGGIVTCALSIGLFVDGQPVAHSGTVIAPYVGCTIVPPCGGIASNTHLFGVMSGVGAGSHTVALAWKVTAGTVSSTTPGPVQVNAMVVG